MLGFSAIADAPIAADNRQDQYLVLASQSLTPTLNSISVSDDDYIALTSQALASSLNNLTVQAAANYALQSQNLQLTLHSVALSTGQTLALTAETPLALALNSIIVEVQPPTFDSQSLALTLNSLGLSAGTTLPLTGQSLSTTLNSVSLSTDHTIGLTGQTFALSLNSILAGVAVPLASQSLTLYQTAVTPGAFTTLALNNTDLALFATLHSFRKFWIPIPTNQIPSTPYDDCSIASTPICYTPPEPSTEPNTQGSWADIALVGPHPPTVWGNITTTQSADWQDIST